MIYYDFNVDPSINHDSVNRTHIIKNYYDETAALDNLHYTRITIPYLQASIHKLRKLQQFNIISVTIDNYSQLKSTLDMQPDLILINPNEKLKLRPGFIRDAINRGLFFEIMFENMNKDWLRCVDDLLRITRGKGIVTGSGGQCRNFIKTQYDVEEFLNAFLNKKAVCKVMQNGEKLLRACAMRRYSFKGMVSNNVPAGLLKQNFIINRFYKNKSIEEER